MKLAFLIANILIISSCSSVLPITEETPINFSEVKNLEYGKITRVELEKVFGKPSSVYHFDQDFVSIDYDRMGTTIRHQRASFNINKKTGQVLSVLWLPNGTDKNIYVDDLKNIFSGAKFTKKRAPQENNHTFIDDYYLIDDSKGISILINNENKSVNTISLSQPSEQRVPATKTKL